MTHPVVQVDWTFNGLWPYQPHYLSTPEECCAYVDEETRRTAHAVLLLHGNPTWSFLWRHVIGALVSAGQRVIAPDLLGFGRSDKPEDLAAYTLDHHVARLMVLWNALDVQEVSLVVHDWGGPNWPVVARRLRRTSAPLGSLQYVQSCTPGPAGADRCA